MCVGIKCGTEIRFGIGGEVGQKIATYRWLIAQMRLTGDHINLGVQQ